MHCLRGQVFGVWKFHVATKADHVNLFKIEEVCTHTVPNKLQIISKAHPWSFTESNYWKMRLMDKH